ncbi:MAG: hypothetical protein R3318_00480 [Gammaproteobacteria bacterium]|nr:hypothetical protein [Gammaproteobacteria bacterium]
MADEDAVIITTDGHVISPDSIILKESTESKEPSVERSVNKNAESIRKFVNHHLKRLERLDDDNVLFMFNSIYFVKTENGFKSEFVLAVNDKFGNMDDHGHTEVQLLEINEDSVRLGYKSEFDHRSFANDKITIDEGTFELNYRNE